MPQKTKEEIRQETPLSVTSTDSPIFKVLKDTIAYVMKKKEGEKGYELTDQEAHLTEGSLLRILQCNDDNTAIHFRWGDGTDVIEISHDLVQFVSGNLGAQVEE